MNSLTQQPPFGVSEQTLQDSPQSFRRVKPLGRFRGAKPDPKPSLGACVLARIRVWCDSTGRRVPHWPGDAHF